MDQGISNRAVFTWPALTAAVLAGVLLAMSPIRASAQTTGYTGVVVDDKVAIRAGAGASFYVVGEATRGQQVQVIEVVEGYVKIVPPAGVYSLISKAFVDAKGDGKSGVVNSDATDAKSNAVFAAPLNNENAYRRQVNLQKGDTVEIVGEEGSNYKIVPPKGAFVYLPPASVRREKSGAAPAQVIPAETSTGSSPEPVSAPAATATEAKTTEPVVSTPTAEPVAKVESPATNPADTTTGTQLEPAKPEAAAPVTEPQPAPKPAPQPAPVVLEPPKPKPWTPEASDLTTAEARLAEAGKQPIKDQPIKDLLTTYRSLSNNAALSPSDHRIVNFRISQLERNLAIQDSLREIETARKEGTTEIKIDEPKPRGPGVFNPADYDAVGQLLASGVYDGETGPRLYRLVEPSNMRTIAYVQGGRKLDPAQTLGKIVGIKGPQRYDPALRLRVITVERVDVLEAETEVRSIVSDEQTPAASTPTSSTPKDDGVYTEVTPTTNTADEPMK